MKNRMTQWFLFLVLIFKMFAAQAYEFEKLPIQEGGRIKPYLTFAQETLELVYGKKTYLNNEAATDIVLTWMIQPEIWQEKAFVEIKYGELKKALKLSETEKYFSPQQILSSDRLSLVMQELNSKREAKEKLDPYFQSVQRLESQLSTFREVATGKFLRFVPPTTGDQWISVDALQGDLSTSFLDLTKGFITYIDSKMSDDKVKAKSALDAFDGQVLKFRYLAQKNNPALYANESKIDAEVFYNHFHPYKWAWIFYVITMVLLLLVWILDKNKLYPAAWVMVFIGLGFHISGFALRSYIIERPPVTNMYETVVWVAFGALLFSMIIEAIYRWRFILFAGSLVASFCLILSDFAPVVLDPSLEPLQPVLRSNYWLLIHVLTITISYAAFFLAFALGDIGLVYYLRGEENNQDKIKAIVLAIYRSIQIGISLLAPGIILGGIWADYSWGRFWGWDPKETWALIALLGYLAVLHGRLAGFIKDFGMVAAGVVSFSLVIMAWYGVNFVLGAGLHSYGFGAGGVEYVSIFVALHIMFVVFVAVTRGKKNKAA